MLLLVVVYDVYATILDARARAGPISETLNRGAWRIVRAVAFRLSRPRRHLLLNIIGPLLLPALIVSYIFILVSGFALIYLPHMPAHFNIAEGAGASPWFESFYFSGVTLTTIGYGDIAPRSVPMRLIALAEGATGFAVISLAVTYLVTVYRALERKRSVALSFYHQAEEGADVARFIAHHYLNGHFYGLESMLRVAARDLQELLESHIEHPIIHYFHTVEVYKSLPRVLFLTLETASVIRSCIDPEEYPETVDHPEVRTLAASARHVLRQLVASLGLANQARQRLDEHPFAEARRWELRYNQTLKQLKHAGIKTRADEDAGREEYRAQREEWEAPLNHFADYLGYEWDEVTGDRDLEYAADETMEEPQAEVRG